MLVRNHAVPADLPTMDDIFRAARCKGVSLEIKTLGPFFRVVASNKEQQRIGVANGFIKPWAQGPILHLDSIRMSRESLSIVDKPLFGIGILVGAAAIRHGYDCGCEKAELLAIDDGNLYHDKLVKYYTRLGFTQVYEVKGGDLLDLLVWGGVGTRMDARVSFLLVKWALYLKSLNGD